MFHLQGHRKLLPVRALYLHDRFSLNQHDYDIALLQLATPLDFGPTLIHLCLPTKDFCENILMPSGKRGVVDQSGRGLNREVVYVTLDECRRQLNVSHPLSNKMFCMKNQREPSGRRLNVLSENKTQPLVGHNITFSPNRTSGTQNVQSLNRTQIHHNATLKSRHQQRSQDGRRSKVSRLCGSWLMGSPVATVEKGTGFLTGLLISSSSGCDGQVFTKVSRYLNWIRPRLLAAEDHMTPQISQYPEEFIDQPNTVF